MSARSTRLIFGSRSASEPSQRAAAEQLRALGYQVTEHHSPSGNYILDTTAPRITAINAKREAQHSVPTAP